MKTSLFSADVCGFLAALAAHQVRYVIIGGLAVIYHGYGRFTSDVDFYYDCGLDNAARLWTALLEFWGGSVPALESASELTNPQLVVQFGRPPNRIDLIANLAAVPFAEVWALRVHEAIEWRGARIPVWLIDLESLRLTKKAAGRPKDHDDLDHLPSPTSA